MTTATSPVRLNSFSWRAVFVLLGSLVVFTLMSVGDFDGLYALGGLAAVFVAAFSPLRLAWIPMVAFWAPLERWFAADAAAAAASGHPYDITFGPVGDSLIIASPMLALVATAALAAATARLFLYRRTQSAQGPQPA